MIEDSQERIKCQATPATAWDHARGGVGRAERGAAMQAACLLMAMHDPRKAELHRMAEQWAEHTDTKGQSDAPRR